MCLGMRALEIDYWDQKSPLQPCVFVQWYVPATGVGLRGLNVHVPATGET